MTWNVRFQDRTRVKGGRMKIVAARRFRKTSVRSHEHQINPRGPKAVERNQLRARTRGMIESLRAVTMKQRDRMELRCGIRRNIWKAGGGGVGRARSVTTG